MMAEQSMEICIHLLRHPWSSLQIKDRAERLRAQLEARLSPEQISMIGERVHATPFEMAAAGLLLAYVRRRRAAEHRLYSLRGAT